MVKLRTLLLILGMMLMPLNPSLPSAVIRVTDPHDLPKVSALLLMKESSGSSTVISSGPQGSDLLTNNHVCEGAKKGGGLVILDGKMYEMVAIKPSTGVDLCLVHVKEDLKQHVELSDKAPNVGDEILTGGYPLTLPIIIQKGFVSKTSNFGSRKAPEVLMVISVLVQPGSSGTGVFNSEGRLVGVIEAMRRDEKSDSVGFGLAVPLRNVRIFMKEESPELQWIPVPHVKRP